jgi:4-aminobutyrate aminotransferase/(S)-3-amino-2-methylpropionate transaminase
MLPARGATHKPEAPPAHRRHNREMTPVEDHRSASGRKIVTDIPGPKSIELSVRRAAALPPGVGVTLPIFIKDASAGIIEDVDGNRLIDFGSGISVTNVGNSAPRVVAAITEQVSRFTHTCYQVTPYESYVEVCEKLN